MRLSIIIPVYNTSGTLAECVHSVSPTTFDDWEIILVDDGSTDPSPSICDTLATQDAHIRVIHQANAGLSAARNAGIEAARGSLLAFADSDDTLRAGTLDSAVRTMEQHPDYDILEFPVSVYHGGPQSRRLDFADKAYAAHDYWIDAQAYTHAYAWNKVYRRQVFDEVRYPLGRYFEDVFAMPLLLRHARTVATTAEGLYYYRYNPQSITANLDGARLNDLLEAHIAVLRHEAWMLKGKDIAPYYAHLLNIQLDVCRLTGRPPVLPPMPFRGTPKLLLLQLLGFKNLSRCHNLLHALRQTFK